MPAKISLIGLRFGKLKVIGDAPCLRSSSARSVRRSLCLCDCGQETIKRNADLVHAGVQSCGCIQREMNWRTFGKHGHAKATGQTRTYKVWSNMIQRCSNPKNSQFVDYGGRGIKVCAEWMSFEQFLSDMGAGKKGWTIERIDNNAGYSLQNCCWATPTRQARNKRNNVRYTVAGVTACMMELCEHFGLSIQTVSARIHRQKWSVERAFLTPVNRT